MLIDIVNSFMFSFCCFVLVCVRLHVCLPASPGSRHRLSEADEDEELLEDDDLGGSTITRFSANPYCV